MENHFGSNPVKAPANHHGFRTYCKVVYSKLSSVGMKTHVREVVNPIICSLRGYRIAEMLLVKKYKQKVQPKSYYTTVVFTIEGREFIYDQRFRFSELYAGYHSVLKMEGPDLDDSEIKRAKRQIVEAIRYVDGQGITDLMPLIEEEIRLEDEAIERAKAEKLAIKEAIKKEAECKKEEVKLEKERKKADKKKQREEQRRRKLALTRPKRVPQKKEQVESQSEEESHLEQTTPAFFQQTAFRQ